MFGKYNNERSYGLNFYLRKYSYQYKYLGYKYHHVNITLRKFANDNFRDILEREMKTFRENSRTIVFHSFVRHLRTSLYICKMRSDNTTTCIDFFSHK